MSDLGIEYDPLKLVVVLNEQLIQGFAPGSFLRIEHAADVVRQVIGVDGEAAYVHSHDQSAIVTMTLVPGAAAVEILYELLRMEIALRDGSTSLSILNPGTESSHVAEHARVMGRPTKVFAGVDEALEWRLACAALSSTYGASKDARTSFVPNVAPRR